MTEWDFCRHMLPHVSRTFALTVPVLPRPLSAPVCCAYLLCRIADTIEDRQDLSPSGRLKLYDQLCQAFDREVDFGSLWPPVEDRHLQDLMVGLPQVMAAWRSLPEGLGGPIRTCVLDMVA